MASVRNVRFDLTVEGLDATGGHVIAFRAVERLSDGCRFTVDLDLPGEPDAAALLGRRADLTLAPGGDEPDRHFRGLVIAASREPRARGGTHLTLEAAARTDLLRLGRNTRMFQRLGVKEIVTQVLAEAGVDDVTWDLASTPPPRDYVVQHGESDAELVTRLLAAEGIAFAVRNDDARWWVHCFDAVSAAPPIAGDDTLVDRAGAPGRENTVWDLTETRRVAHDAVVLRDYDFEKPALDLTRSARAAGSRGLEAYLHPGGFRTTARGEQLARIALERARCDAVAVTGATDCVHLEPGRTFAVDAHRRQAANRRLLAIEVVHRGADDREGGAPTYENAFLAIPAAVPWRPASQVAPPAPGPQVAFATGPAGQELHGSAHGQVKVRFAWDRSGVIDDRSSTWLRVGQLALGGSLTIPRVGFEVLVDFELGDVDRPFVAGHLYNGEARPPYALPEGATRSALQTATTSGGAGANELRFEDKAGSEEIFVNASYDYVCSAEHDAVVEVGADEKVKIGQKNEVTIKANEKRKVLGGRKLAVAAEEKVDVGADLAIGVKGDQRLTVGGARSVTVQGDLSENVKGDQRRTVSALQSVTGIGAIQRKVIGSSQQEVGAAWLEATGGSRASTVNGDRSEMVGGLKLVKAKTISVGCKLGLTVLGAAELVKCGGNRTDSAGAAAALSAGGGLSVQAGGNVNITGEHLVVLQIGGATLRLTPSKVVVKAPKVKLKSFDDLKSTGGTHETN